VLIACTSPPDVLEMPSRVPVPPRQAKAANFPEANRAAIGTPGSSDEEVEGEVDTDAKKKQGSILWASKIASFLFYWILPGALECGGGGGSGPASGAALSPSGGPFMRNTHSPSIATTRGPFTAINHWPFASH
jgi:hypothetical protein